LNFVIALAVATALVLLRKRIFGRIDRLNGPWLNAWLKALLIAVAIALLVAVIPAKVLEFDAVADLDRTAQDLIGAGLSLGGLLVVFVALRQAQKHDRI
jgi:hypothetical protein